MYNITQDATTEAIIKAGAIIILILFVLITIFVSRQIIKSQQIHASKKHGMLPEVNALLAKKDQRDFGIAHHDGIKTLTEEELKKTLVLAGYGDHAEKYTKAQGYVASVFAMTLHVEEMELIYRQNGLKFRKNTTYNDMYKGITLLDPNKLVREGDPLEDPNVIGILLNLQSMNNLILFQKETTKKQKEEVLAMFDGLDLDAKINVTIPFSKLTREEAQSIVRKKTGKSSYVLTKELGKETQKYDKDLQRHNDLLQQAGEDKYYILGEYTAELELIEKINNNVK